MSPALIGNKNALGAVHDAVSRARTSEAMKDYHLAHPERGLQMSKKAKEWWNSPEGHKRRRKTEKR